MLHADRGASSIYASQGLGIYASVLRVQSNLILSRGEVQGSELH